MNKPDKLDISSAQYRTLALLMQHYLPDSLVWAYGSRTQNQANEKSDLDLVAFTTKTQKSAFYDLKEAFEESDLPFRVDLFQWDDLPEDFQNKINNHHIVLQVGK